MIPFFLLCGCAATPVKRVAAPAPPGRAELVASAEKLVAGMDGSFLGLFPTTGYADYAGFLELLNKNSDSLGREFVDMILQEKSAVGIYARESSRPFIAAGGFLNIHASGESSFSVGVKGRNAVEASCLGLSFEDYAPLPAGLKPKYGLLMPPLGSVLLPADISQWYGTDVYVIKTANVRNRLTWAPGDSLDRVDKWTAAKGIRWREGEVFKPQFWDLAFVPWSRRGLIIPLMSEDVKASGRLAFSSTPQHPVYVLPVHGPSVKTGWPGPNAGYLEVQLWGPVDLRDVESFIFRVTVPEGEFLRELKRHNIGIFDGRGPKPVKWLSLFFPSQVFIYSA